MSSLTLDTPPTFTDLRLDKVKYAAQTMISDEELHNARFESYVDQIARGMVMRLSAEVLEHKIAESTYTMTVPYPASPWNHFKYKHRNAWWMRPIIKRHPIRYTHKKGAVTLSKAHRFPKATFNYPDTLGPLIVAERGELTY